MTARAIILLLAIGATSASAEEAKLPVHSAGYEVVTGDPSCNGPHQRLIRATLSVPNLLQEIKASPVCQIRERKGGQLEAREFPCDAYAVQMPVNGNGLPATDKIALNATVEICQGLWDFSVKLTDADLSGSFSGREFDPVTLNLWGLSDSMLRHTESDTGRLSVSIRCAPDPLAPDAAPPFDFEALFRLTEIDANACSGDACAEVADPVEEVEKRSAGLWSTMSISAECRDPAARAAP
ncbi:hypothetical protein [Tabrizicola sp.]|uniref:hypothetical protein n=1 Tax=Tabrizicola sp. TaxID=2005166 RepID=UPI003F36504E